MTNQKNYNLFTFFTLYIAQSIPMSFFSAVLPILMRQGNYSLTAIALLKLIKLPWIIKFLWSPLVDRRTDEVKDYKRWIVGSEIVYAVLIIAVALLDIGQHFGVIIGLVLLAFIMSATQDIATDALAARAFGHRDRSLLNSMQSMGSFAGSMVGSGLLLLLFHQIGWRSLLPWVALFVLIALAPLVLNHRMKLSKRHETRKANCQDMLTFFTRRGIGKHMVFLLLFYAGMMGLLSNLRPMLVDFGYDMKEIGLIVGIFGTAMGICGSFVSGVGIHHIGRKWISRTVALMIVVAAGYFFGTHLHGVLNTNTVAVYIGIGLIWWTYGMASTLVYTISMDLVRDGREGTDFTLQIVVTHLSSMVFAIVCSRIADVVGYGGMFGTEVFMGIIATLYVWQYRPLDKELQ